MEEELTKEQISLILKGEYKANFIKAFGITHYHYSDCEDEKLVNTEVEIDTEETTDLSDLDVSTVDVEE